MCELIDSEITTQLIKKLDFIQIRYDNYSSNLDKYFFETKHNASSTRPLCDNSISHK